MLGNLRKGVRPLSLQRGDPWGKLNPSSFPVYRLGGSGRRAGRKVSCFTAATSESSVRNDSVVGHRLRFRAYNLTCAVMKPRKGTLKRTTCELAVKFLFVLPAPTRPSFSTALRQGSFPIPATLGKPLIRIFLFYRPRASLDAEGQWPLCCAGASPTEGPTTLAPRDGSHQPQRLSKN